MLDWIDDVHFELDGTTFRIWDVAGGTPDAQEPADDTQLVLLKPRSMIERYLSLRERFAGGTVFELGIYHGGSTAFLALLLTPRKLVAIEWRPEPADALTRFVAARDLDRSIRPHYGVDQADRRQLAEILDAELGTERLDVVVDDASHQLPETTASFNALFPRLRPGGVFVIEDWSAVHIYERIIRRDTDLLSRIRSEPLRSISTPLSHLALQLVLANAYAPDVVARVEVHPELVIAERGPSELDAERFDIGSRYGEIGDYLLAPVNDDITPKWLEGTDTWSTI